MQDMNIASLENFERMMKFPINMQSKDTPDGFHGAMRTVVESTVNHF